MAVRFQLRRDTAANWTAANPTLALGEPGVETDTLKVKVGDGATAWNSLGYSITKDFNDLTNTPTTVAGYNITDALTLTALSVTQNAASGTGALTYNNTTGVFEYTPPNFEGLNGNFTGSVFADDSTAMIDGVAGKVVGDVENTNTTTTNLFASTIDTTDSSAITITPDVVMSAGLTVGNHIIPSSNVNIDLGSATNRFRDLYLSGDTINLGGAIITKGAGNTIQLPVGTTLGGVKAPDQTLDTTDDATFNSVTGNIFTSLIDSADSSAITVTPDVVLSAGLTVGNHIIPSSNLNIDLGSATNRFRELFLSGNTISLDSLKLSSASGALLIHDGAGNRSNIQSHNIDANDVAAAGNVTVGGYLAGPATFVIDPAAVGDNTGTVVIAGNLQVDGTTTTINSTTVEVDDKNVVLATGSVNKAASDGAGITVDNGSDTDATILYDATANAWDFNVDVDVAGIVTATEINLDATGDIHSTVDTGYVGIAGGTNSNVGANALFYGGSHATLAGVTKFRSGSSSTVTILANGNVGLGYDSPADNIHILGSSGSPNVGITLQSHDTANATAALSLYARDPSNVNKVSELKNVAGQLFIERSDAGTDVLALKSTAAGAGGPQLDFYHHSASPADNDVIGTVNFNGWDNASNATTFARVSGVASDVTNGVEKGDLVFSTRRDGSTFDEKFRIAHEGYLVAQSASQVRLVLGSEGTYNNNTSNWIRGNGTGLGFNTAGGDYNWEVTGGNVMSLTGSNGWLGIGNITATKPLDVNGAIRTRTGGFNLADGTTQVGAFVLHKEITGSGTDNSGVLFAETGLDLHFMTNGSANTKMIINTDGNVGIGDNPIAPTRELEIRNDSPASNTGIKIHNNSSAHAAIIEMEGGRTSDTQDVSQILTVNLGNNITNIRTQRKGADGGEIAFWTSAAGSGDALTQRMVIDEDGKVGVGVTGPSASFDVQFARTDTDPLIAQFRNTSSGQDARLMVATVANSSGDPYIKYDAGGTNFITGLYWQGTSNNQLRMGAGERPSDGSFKGITIHGNGATGINDTDPSGTKSSGGTTYANGFSVNANGFTNCAYFEYDNTGAMVTLNNTLGSGTRYFLTFDNGSTRAGSISWNGSNLTYGDMSDYRLKENVSPLTGAVDRIKALNPVSFTWKSNGLETEGFIAHELQQVIPHAVSGDKDGIDDKGNPEYQQVDPRHLVATLTSALKEAIGRIETLEAEVQALKGE